MKKYILCLGVVVGLLASTPIVSAQTILLTSGGSATGTVTNAGTTTLTSKAVVNNEFQHTSVQVEVTKTSGTVAGTLSLFGSVDGTNFRSISSTTFTATDVASQGFIWQITGSPVPFYQVTYTGSGTMVATFQAKLVSR